MSRAARCLLYVALLNIPLRTIAQDQKPASPPVSSAVAESVSGAVRQYFDAYSKKDLAAMTAFWDPKAESLEQERKRAERLFADIDQITIHNLMFQDVKVDGSRAQVRVHLEISAMSLKTGKLMFGLGATGRVFEFEKLDRQWKILRIVNLSDELASQLIASKDPSERQALLQQHPDLVSPALIRSLGHQGQDTEIHGSYDEAIRIYRFAREIAEGIHDENDVAGLSNNVGIVHFQQAKYRDALLDWQETIRIGQDLDDQSLLSDALGNVGLAHKQLGNYSEALSYQTKSLALYDQMGSDYGRALQYNNIGELYRLVGDYDTASTYLNKSLASAKKAADNGAIALALMDLGILDRFRGNYGEALSSYKQALELSKQEGDQATVAQLLNNIGDLFAAQNDHIQAMSYFKQSADLAKQIGLKQTMAEALTQIGDEHRDDANYAAALEAFQTSQPIFEEIGDRQGVAATLGAIGSVYRLQGNLGHGAELLQKGLVISEELHDQREIALTLVQLAGINLERGRPQEALESAARATAIARELGDHEALWESRTMEGETYRSLHKFKEAQQAFEEAIAAVETLRTNVAGGEEAQQRFFENKLAPYVDMVALAVDQKNPEQALAYAERSKSRVLLDVLATGRVRINGEMSEAEEEREKSLEQALASTSAQLQHERSDTPPDPARLADLQTKVEKSRLEYADFQTDLYLLHPHLRTKRGLAPLISEKEAAGLLPDAGTTLIEFVVGDKTTYLLTLVRGAGDIPDLQVFEIPTSKEDLGKRVEHFREQLAQRDLSFSGSARELYDLLLKPAALQLKGAKTLVIVPDGPLWVLPFQALKDAHNDYLLSNYVVAYVPSLTVLREMVRPGTERDDTNAAPAAALLAMGNPTFAEATAARLEMAYRSEKLVPLPAAEKEVEMLGQLYGSSQSKVYVGAEAREDRFKTEAGSFKVLHLATHGFFDDASPMYSYVVLSSGESSQEDGLLEAWEIMNLDLKADVAVLSACETARGRIGGGEGIIGLTWAFFVAGVPTTVASQWKVESDSTTELMLAFHRARRVMKAQKNSSFATAKALRMAELELLHKGAHTHPFYWAGFVLTGNPN